MCAHDHLHMQAHLNTMLLTYDLHQAPAAIIST